MQSISTSTSLAVDDDSYAKEKPDKTATISLILHNIHTRSISKKAILRGITDEKKPCQYPLTGLFQ